MDAADIRLLAQHCQHHEQGGLTRPHRLPLPCCMRLAPWSLVRASRGSVRCGTCAPRSSPWTVVVLRVRTSHGPSRRTTTPITSLSNYLYYFRKVAFCEVRQLTQMSSAHPRYLATVAAAMVKACLRLHADGMHASTWVECAGPYGPGKGPEHVGSYLTHSGMNIFNVLGTHCQLFLFLLFIYFIYHFNSLYNFLLPG